MTRFYSMLKIWDKGGPYQSGSLLNGFRAFLLCLRG